MGVALEPVVNIGQEGVTPTVVESAKEVIKKRELIKVRVQKNAPGEVQGPCHECTNGLRCN